MSFDHGPSGYTDLVVSGNNVRLPASSQPTTVTWNGLEVLSFASGELVYFEGMQMPHGYIEETDMYFHLHFVNDTSFDSGETIIWEVKYTICSIFDVFPSTSTVTITLTNNTTLRAKLDPAALNGTTVVEDTHLIIDGVTISGTGVTKSAIMMGAIEYDPASAATYPGECIFLSADAHYQLERFGSYNEFTG